MKNRLDKNKYLRKLKFKRLWRRYERYVYLGVSCLVIAILGIYFAHSKFSVSKEEEVIRTTVGNFIHGDVVIGAYVDGEYSLTIPGKNDGYVVKNVVCDNDAVGKWDDDKWGLLTTNMTRRTKCNIYFVEKPVPIVDKVTTLASSDTTNFASDDPDSNIRYIGANPDNYVYFNCSDYNNQSDSTCEKWRIIGVFNSVTKSDGSKGNLVKIMRDESIGKYSWDDNKKNDWSKSTLQTYLNSGTYYTTTLKNDITRDAIESVTWKLGGSDIWTGEDLSTNTLYASENGTSVYTGNSTKWTGKIAIPYSSDFGYATAGNSNTTRNTCLNKDLQNYLSDCSDNDYLYKSNHSQWTLTTYTGEGYAGFDTFGGDPCGIFSFSASTFDGVFPIPSTRDLNVHPTVFLKSNIYISSGTGSLDNPYQLNL